MTTDTSKTGAPLTEKPETLKQTPAGSLRWFATDADPAGFELSLKLRRDVFVNEQDGPPEDEPDEYDPDAVHWLLCSTESGDENSGEPIATGRLVPYQEACQMQPVAKIGRLAVAQSRRGEGLGKLLMIEMIAWSRAEGYAQSILHAQTHAIPFYAALGYEAEGPEFEEGGIPHRLMRLVL